ncbi:MAG TPA: hypothetical protein PLD20_30560 [Blastocatellia bacterium]|nr:hypothetical protein [Blastocatellia bacterium]HMV82164.1 hypothetical protein [Blastocatellia bacterium]HMX26176.1 hypothetical protein [Blastocatellia bacterium]HMY74266.1 hypothetical protein [Blastocatellia bacterium]HMZ22313.1 hypothetical protein [Blastocatellia bacterium]
MSTAAKELLHRKIEALPDEQVEQLLLSFNALFSSTEGSGPVEHSSRKPNWDRVFANKLRMKEKPYAIDLSEVSGDDFLY